MPQSANDQVEHGVCGSGHQLNGCFNASVGKRSSGTPGAGDVCAAALCFNASVGKRSSGTPMGENSAPIPSAVSMPQSANDQVERNALHDETTCQLAVSMPQSANDQVEHQPVHTTCIRSRQFQCLSRQTIKWNIGTTFGAGDGVKFQCLSRQTIKWNVHSVAILIALQHSFNASVGKRSSGTGRGRR